MLRIHRRAVPVLAAGTLVLVGCGGAGYGTPIAATDGSDATVALRPAPQTTPQVQVRTTTGVVTRTTTTPGTSTGGDTSGGSGSDDGGGGSQGGGSGESSGSDSGASLAAYAADASRFCTGYTTSTKALTEAIGAAGTNAKAVGRAAVQYGTAIGIATEGLEAAPVPSAVRSYHQRTLRWSNGVTSVIRQNRSGLLSGQKSAGAAVIARVQQLGRPPLGSAVPAVLRSRAPSCAG